MAYNQAKFESQLTAVCDFIKEALLNFGKETATENVVDLTKAIELVANEGDFAAVLAARARNARARYAGAVGSETIVSLLDPVFQNYLRGVIGVPVGEVIDVRGSWARIVEHFLFSAPGVARSPIISVQSREITRATTSGSSSGTGNGVLYRLTKDRYGIEVEGSYTPLTIDFECVQDETSGTEPGEEVFSIAAPSPTDILDQGDDVTFDPQAAVQGQNSDGSFLSDASFQLTTNTAGIADPDDLGAWIDSAAVYGSAKYALITEAVLVGGTFMSSAEEEDNENAVALEIKGSHTIQQELTGLDPFTPYFWSMRIRPGASLSAGGLTVSWGSHSQVLDLTSITAGTFTIFVPDLDEDLFPYSFSDASNLFKIAITTPLVGDTVIVDNVRFGPMTPFGGTWWKLDPSTTQFLAGASAKTFQFADTLVGTDSIIQRIIHLGYGLYLPHDDGTPTGATISDP